MTQLKKLAPTQLASAYHFALAYVGALVYGFPSKRLLVVAVTGTKGKSSVCEMVNAILEEAGYKTALLNSIRIKIADDSAPNVMRMSMPGRFFIQRFLRRAVRASCTAAILEMTSEGARQHRHRAIALDSLIFTNLAPEHIESHGSYEKYADAKFEIGLALARSPKRPRVIVANADDPQSARYLALTAEKTIGFSLKEHEHEASERGGHFVFDKAEIAIRLPGDFSLKNALAAASLVHALDISTDKIQRALEKIECIPGRAERIEAGQTFTVVVDYAHTPDSLQALYDAYKNVRKICVLGNTGGGRDTWKRPVMGKIADDNCAEVILTNEDPYDEDPRTIVEEMTRDMRRSPTIIMDRREAIREAFRRARGSDAVLITGKGTDPCICVEDGKKIPWSEAQVVREEVERLLGL
ncbi:MAG TPA: UDP-N-acetylmuramyl-tripeptide synthetase [Candidatus Paceibacterota bacterium]